MVLPRQAFRDQGDRGHGEGIPRLLVPYQGLPHRHGAGYTSRPHRRPHRSNYLPKNSFMIPMASCWTSPRKPWPRWQGGENHPSFTESHPHSRQTGARGYATRGRSNTRLCTIARYRPLAHKEWHSACP